MWATGQKRILQKNHCPHSTMEGDVGPECHPHCAWPWHRVGTASGASLPDTSSFLVILGILALQGF